MVHFRNKRSSKSIQRGRGKRHAVNKEKAITAKNKAAKAKKTIAANNKRIWRIKAIAKAFWSGKHPDWETAEKKTK